MRERANFWLVAATAMWLTASACSDEAEPNADGAAGSAGSAGSDARGGSAPNGGDGSGQEPSGGDSAGGRADSAAGSGGDAAGAPSTPETGGQGGSLDTGAGSGGLDSAAGGGGAPAGAAGADTAGAAGSGPSSEDTDQLCGDGIDNDGDDTTDCEDDDCKMAWLTACAEICDDSVDNDGDGDQDCDDRACNGQNGAAVDPNCDMHRIQHFQDGTVPLETAVHTFPVYVTGIRDVVGARHLFLQEAAGVTVSPHTYPAYAGIHFYATAGEVTALGIGSVVVGDCVQLRGTLTELFNSTEITTATEFAVVGSGCGSMPLPQVAAVASIATDTDTVTNGSQPGASAETYESVLLSVETVTTATVTAGDFFTVTPSAGAESLTVDNYLYTYADPTVAQTFTLITGVLDQFNSTFRLLPRSDADLSSP